MAGTCGQQLQLRQYSTAADCTGASTIITTNCVLSADWLKCENTLAAAAWAGGTQSYRFQLHETGDNGVTSNWDAPYILADPTNMPLSTDHHCGADTDETASCSAIVLPSASPLRNHFNGETQVEFTASTPWNGVDITAARTLVADGLGANSFDVRIWETTDEPSTVVTDAASAAKYNNINVLNWAANTDYRVKARMDGRNDGAGKNLWFRWNDTWITATSGLGTGMRSAAQATTYWGSTASVGYDVVFRDVVFLRRFRD